jgi:hypothetical protein
MVVDDESWSDESSNAEEEVDELYPIILVVTGKEDEDAEVAQHVEHATAGADQEHAYGQIHEAERKGTGYEHSSEDDYQADHQLVVREEPGKQLDQRASNQVASCSGEKDEGEVGFVVACHLAEVEDDGADCCHHAAVEGVQERVGGEVDVAKLYHLYHQTGIYTEIYLQRYKHTR